MLCEIEDAKYLTIGTLIWWAQGEEWLKVAAPPQRFMSSLLTQHAQVLLAKAQLRNGAPA